MNLSCENIMIMTKSINNITFYLMFLVRLMVIKGKSIVTKDNK